MQYELWYYAEAFVEFFARIFSTGREQVVVGIFQSLNAVMPCLFAKWRLPEWLGGMLQQLTLKGTFRCSLDGQTHTFWLYRWSWVHTLQVTAFRKIFCKISKCPDIQGICIKNHKDIYTYIYIYIFAHWHYKFCPAMWPDTSHHHSFLVQRKENLLNPLRRDCCPAKNAAPNDMEISEVVGPFSTVSCVLFVVSKVVDPP